jgi:hypothetical protein
MDIEIDVVGKSNKWILNQPLIRIGSGASCELSLPARQYPSVLPEHLALEVAQQSVRLAGSSAHGDIYLNDQPATFGAAIQTGDILRLGAGGPELRIRFQERSPHTPPKGYEPTRLMRSTEAPAYEPTRVVSVSGMVSDSETRNPPAGIPGKRAVPPAAGTVEAPYSTYSAPGASSRGGAAAPIDRGQESWKPMPRQDAVPAAPKSSAAAAAGTASSAELEGKLKLMQYIQIANLVVVVLMLVWIVQLNRQLSENRDELNAMRVQAQSAVSQFTPALDAKLGGFEKQMDGLDTKLKATEERMELSMGAKMKQAQDEMFTSMDAKMKATEDHMVTRMNTEIPSMLDKYVNQKLSEFKH